MLEQIGYDALKIRETIDIYERLHPSGPDSIAMAILDTKAEQLELAQSRIINIFGVVNNNEAGRRLKFAMPSNLYITLKKRFPTLFGADIKQFERDFPVFFKGWRT